MKKSRKHTIIILIVLGVVVLTAGGIYGYQRFASLSEKKLETELPGKEGTLNVYYLDLGSGASAVLAESNEKFMLIDGGSEETADELIECLKSMGVERLEYVILSSYEDGRLPGAVEVMKEFEVSTILSPDYVQDSLAYEDYQALLAEGNLEEIHPNAEEIYAFSNTFFTVVGPRKYGQGGSAADSLCIRLDFGETSFLFCGDSGREEQEEMAEADLADTEETLKADVYFISDADRVLEESFLNCVRPDYAVLSSGGELPDSVRSLLNERDVQLYQIDVDGHICAFSDGRSIVWEKRGEPKTDRQ